MDEITPEQLAREQAEQKQRKLRKLISQFNRRKSFKRAVAIHKRLKRFKKENPEVKI